MRLVFGILITSLGLSSLPTQAQALNIQEKTLVEASRLAASNFYAQKEGRNFEQQRSLIAQSSRTPVRKKPLIVPLPLPTPINEPADTEPAAKPAPKIPVNVTKPNTPNSPRTVQVADAQVTALVEALRLAAPKTGKENDGLYTDWQIMPSNIPRWSKQCTGKELTPTEFEANPTRARQILTCVMRNVLGDEYQTSNSNEPIAVQRAAAWWMTGDAAKYSSSETSPYTKKVLAFYQQLRTNKPVAGTTVTPKPVAGTTVTTKPVAGTTVTTKPVTTPSVVSKPVPAKPAIPALMPHL